jgi:hypothetical protein
MIFPSSWNELPVLAEIYDGMADGKHVYKVGLMKAE